MIVREASGWDVLAVVRNMRASDAEEQFAVRFDVDTPDTRLRLAVELLAARQMAIKCYALCVEEPVPVALVGAFLVAPGVASLHRVATERWPEIARLEYRFLRRRFIPHVLAPNVRFAECRVPADDDKTLHWLIRLGFTPVGAALPYGKDGRRFMTLAWINPRGSDDGNRHL